MTPCPIDNGPLLPSIIDSFPLPCPPPPGLWPPPFSIIGFPSRSSATPSRLRTPPPRLRTPPSPHDMTPQCGAHTRTAVTSVPHEDEVSVAVFVVAPHRCCHLGVVVVYTSAALLMFCFVFVQVMTANLLHLVLGLYWKVDIKADS
ncbi:hypothetical protein Pmani_008015 [Petrolisthes manimaculis]|uniref:Uncharacterized protein n=1 Tax=Petrolisthes manimaculis TaxID=1843537 RepID=A0AAE1Q7R9_9EUCA|nr:hypothetical protein Pmani_008015 [Petrolisthes manimaculis]